MKPSPAHAAEWRALGLLCALAAVLALLEPIAQPQAYHRLADTRALRLGALVLPNAADVLSSLAFVAVGAAGLVRLGRLPPPQRLTMGVLFAALCLTGPGSIAYHLSPTDASLLWDRLAMTPAFAGALGALAAERLGAAAGRRWLLGWLVLGAAALAQWVWSGDLRLYLVAQFGGFAVLLLWFRLPAAPGMLRLPWGWLLFAYALAKVFELADGPVWMLSGGLVSGHPLKHLVAALGVVPLLRVLYRTAPAAPWPPPVRH